MQTLPPTLRRLLPDDAADFRTLRLQALQDTPWAYGSSYQDWAEAPLQRFAERLQDSYVIGAFAGPLVGVAAYDREPGGHARHRGWITAVYVRPDQRGGGTARTMLAALIAEARRDGLLQLELQVATDNDPAIRCYLALGFQPHGLCPRALMVQGRFIDERLMVLPLDA